MSNLTRSQQNTTPIHYEESGIITSTSIGTIRIPVSSHGVAPSNNADPLPKMILLVLLSGLAIALFSWLLGRPSAEQQELAAQNARLQAQNQAIAGCVTGVMGQQQ